MRTREIKFRAWDKIDNMMYFTDETYKGKNSELFEQFEKNEVDRELMQFTGLLDKHGKEIYEGDIVKGREGMQIGDVRFGQYEDFRQQKHDNILWHIGWYVQGKDRIYSLEELEWYIKPSNYVPFRGSYLEIIGNIYENPDLLQTKDKPNE